MATKVVVTGPVCAGKTSFVRLLSQEDALSTEASVTSSIGKEETTVGMDIGQVGVGERSVKLFGTPGQNRFAYMWDILASGADGVLLLIPADRPQAVDDAKTIADDLPPVSSLPMGIGVTRSDLAETPVMPAVQRQFGSQAAFIERIDGRVAEECRGLLTALLETMEAVG
ncbi:hypothetical protein BSZ35_00820 [Salinibacter sp. 10B]|uniref:GTP-binding protein n=1 Tax=Salinibacter sp. 10B TaxID=1923971 RepID=UPI000CF51B65|nr:GTPase [Salinibacter sp. 10B]PQJ33333.1 hypothetical protein BSZ35_00820 [Salinibacter sp. 10B]